MRTDFSTSSSNSKSKFLLRKNRVSYKKDIFCPDFVKQNLREVKVFAQPKFSETLFGKEEFVNLQSKSKNMDRKSIVLDLQGKSKGYEHLDLPIFFDRCFDKNRIKTFIGWLLANFGENATVYIVEKLKNLGFYFATEAGISLSIDDLQVPANKNWFLSQAEKDIKRNNNNFQCGNLTPVEQSQQLLDRWHRTSETLRESVIQSFRLTNTLNPVYMMAFSGARGNISQVRQLVGMRGLMADPQGQIISFPIRSNFREGLTLTEYVISCYGARKGVVDTALRTADSGYLTRRLVDVSQHVVVWTFDCKTDAGIHLIEMKEGKKVILSLKKRILGRVLAQEIPTIAFRNQQISAQLAQQIVSLKEHVLVRSPLSCSVPNSVCQLCYGWSLSRGRIVSLGEAVGVIAAQSIGEPGTQLTMRTFHTGGVFSGDVIDEIRAPHDGVVYFLQPLLGQLIRTSHGKIAYLTRANGSFAIEENLIRSNNSILLEKQLKKNLVDGDGNENLQSKFNQGKSKTRTVITLEPGTALFVRQGEKVIAKQLLAEYSSISAQTKERVEAQHQVYSDQKGEIFFDDVVLGKKLKKEDSEAEKGSPLNLRNQFKQGENLEPQGGRRVDIVTSLKLNTLWILSGTLFKPPVSSTLYAKIGDLVDKTTLLTLIQSELNLQTSHLDEKYILSAQLKKNQITKRKEKLLTFFKKSSPSSKLPKVLDFDSKSKQNQTGLSQRRNLEYNDEKRESLFLNKFSLNLTTTDIKYKKSGYFFTSRKKEKISNFYSLLFQAGIVNLINNLTHLKNYKENNKASGWNLGFNTFDPVKCEGQKRNPFVDENLQSRSKEKKVKNLFVLAPLKQIRISSLDQRSIATPLPNANDILEPVKATSTFQKETDILRLFAASPRQASKITRTKLVSAKPKQEASFFLNFLKENQLSKDVFGKQSSKILTPKYSKESAKAKDLCFKTRINLITLNEKKKVQKRNKVEKKRGVNHFFTTTSLNQPFSNCREFQNEFALQWFSPLFKTETGGLIYTNIHYCNKRSIEAHIFFIAEENYGKKDLVKMNSGRRKKSFNIVPFKELMASPTCLTNVSLNGKSKPSSSFKNDLLSFSGSLANTLSTKCKESLFLSHGVNTIALNLQNKSKGYGAKHGSKINSSTDYENNVFFKERERQNKRPEESFVKVNKTVSINSFLSEIYFSQDRSLKKELFFLRKKENLAFYSVRFHSTKTETFNIAINLLKKGFLSFKNKWVETGIPLGYQKNLQGSQLPFYSTENGILRNNLTPSFFTNSYSNYWKKKKSKKISGSFLKDFLPITFGHPLPHIKVKNKKSSTKKTFLVDDFYLNKSKFFGQDNVLARNFSKKPISRRNYQKDAWLTSQERKKIISYFAPSSEATSTSSVLYSKKKTRFFLAFLLAKSHLNLAKNKPLNFNPFPSKGNYLSSAFIFRINSRAVYFHNLQKQSSVFYNSYPYPQPILVEFLQNRSCLAPSSEAIINFNNLTKSLNINLDLQDKHAVGDLDSKSKQSKTLFSLLAPTKNAFFVEKQKNVDLIEVGGDVDGNLQSKFNTSNQSQSKAKENQNLENLEIVKNYEFPQNKSKSEPSGNKKFNKFSSFLQKLIKKRSIKKQRKRGENLQKSNLQIRPGWLYLPKDQFQTGKVHQSFLPPFQQNVNEILFDQVPVYIESVLRKNFEEQLVDKYLLPSTDVIDFCQAKTLVEKSQLQKFINQISMDQRSVASPRVSTKLKQQAICQGEVFNERSNKFLLSLRETFWRGSTFSSSIENDFTTFYDNNKNAFKFSENNSLYQTNLRTNLLNHTPISSTSSFLSFLLRNKKEKRIKYLQEKKIFPQETSHQFEFLQTQDESTEKQRNKNSASEFFQEGNKELKFRDFKLLNKKDHVKNGNKEDKDNGSQEGANHEKLLFLRPVSINPIKIAFQVITNKSCRFHSIRSFALSCVNNTKLDFSQDFFLQSQITERKLSQNETHTKNNVNPGLFLCLPQISRIYFVKNKPFSDFVLLSHRLNFDPIKIKSHVFFDKKQSSCQNEKEVSPQETLKSELFSNTGGKFSTFDEIKGKEIKYKEQDLPKSLTLSEKNKSLICEAKQILVSIDQKPNKYKNLSKLLQSKTFLIQNFSTNIDTDYFSFLVLIPSFFKNKKSANGSQEGANHDAANVFNTFDQVQCKKPEQPPDLQNKNSKFWLLIRKADEYPLLDTSIFQQKRRLHKGNQPFFEKELIYSSTPLSLYMSNRISFSSKFNKQKKEEIYLSFYHSPKVSLKIKEKTFYLLSAFSKLESQYFANASADSAKTKFFEEKLKLPQNLFSCQKAFWQMLDLYHQNLQKNKFFEKRQALLVKKSFGVESKDILRDNVPTVFAEQKQEGSRLLRNRDGITVQNRTWFFQKENLENVLSPQEKEQTIIRFFKQSYLLHFFLNFNISNQSPLQRIEIKTAFEKIEGSNQISSCAHCLNLGGTQENKNYFTNGSQEGAKHEKTNYFQKKDKQSKFSAFARLNFSERGFAEQNFMFPMEKLRIILGRNLNDNLFSKVEKDPLSQDSIFTKQLSLRNREDFHKVKSDFPKERLKSWKYSFTPFARDLSFTLSFTAKLNQSWFFSLANKVENKIGIFESSPFQRKEFIKETFIPSSKTLSNEKKTKESFVKNKKSISKQRSSYPLKEKNSYTNLLLDQTITTSDKVPIAITAIMSREEGEIENLKSNSTCLILKNSDIEIYLTKKEKPFVVVGQLIRYGEEIANGIAAPKSGQIIQVDTNKVTLRKAQPILFPRGGSVDVSHGDYVKEGSPLLSLSYQRLVTGDIVQGIPKIEQLFEARETEGGQPLLSSLHSELEAIFLSYSAQLGLKLAVRESFKEIQQIIVDRVQRVYIAQGVLIADKHFEVVIRQMTSKVRILDGGRPGFLYGELVDLRRVELLNAGVPFANEQAVYEPIILGISKACLEAEGFLSPASFQETTRVLSLAAIERKTDFLRGIKERVILGDVIQAGTGFTLYDRPVRKIKQEECIDLSLSVLHNAHSILSTNHYYRQL